jgi:hypothetical protein
VLSWYNNTPNSLEYLVPVCIEFKQMRSDQLMVQESRVSFVIYLKSILNIDRVRLIDWHQLANELSPICYMYSNNFINYFFNHLECLLVSNSINTGWNWMLPCECNHVLIIINCSNNLI